MNPITKAIERMFSNELSGHKWVTLTVEAVAAIYAKYSDEEIKAYSDSGRKFPAPLAGLNSKIKTKLRLAKKVEDQVLYLNERMMG
jgi:hypothetical protein